MKTPFIENSFRGKSYSNPQIQVIKIAEADVISTSNERYEEEDTDDWYNSPTRYRQ